MLSHPHESRDEASIMPLSDPFNRRCCRATRCAHATIFTCCVGFRRYSFHPDTDANPVSELFVMPVPTPLQPHQREAQTPHGETASVAASPPTSMLHNRVAAVMLHIPWYSITGPARLARDAGVAKSTISRLLSGKSTPSYRLVMAVTHAIETRANRPIGVHELFSADGAYGTERVCSLMGCKGCLPGEIYDRHTDKVQSQFRTLRPGTWELSVRAGEPATVTAHSGINEEGGPMT
jgi:transcriptional regulator with XRE-family HTH domain